jgi:hypothetical protein
MIATGILLGWLLAPDLASRVGAADAPAAPAPAAGHSEASAAPAGNLNSQPDSAATLPAAGPAQATPGSIEQSPSSRTLAAPEAAAAAARASLLPLAKPLWSDLKAAQQVTLAPFAEGWNALPLEEKRAWVALANNYPKLTAAQQAKASERIHEWARLTPEQRKLARQNYRLAKTLPRDEREAQLAQYKTLTDEQKKVLQTSGNTSNTGAKHAGARTALAKEASQPLSVQPAAVAPGLRLPTSAASTSIKP